MASAALIVIGVITLLIWLFGFIPFICFHLLRFYNFRYDITLSKRYPKITLITICALLSNIIIFVLEVVRLFFDGPLIFEEIYDFINIGVNFVFACSILWRFWLSYYDIQFSVSTSSREWQKFIDTDAQFDNWYFKNRKRYGDYTWTKKRFLIGTTALIIIYVLLSLPSALGPIRVLFVISPWVGILVVYCKTPEFYDEFAIRQEMKRIIYLYAIGVGIVYIIYIILIFIISQSTGVTTGATAALAAVALNFLALVLFLIGHTMTYWVLKTVDVGFDDNGDPIRAPLNPWAQRNKKSHVPKTSESNFESMDGDGGIPSQSDSQQGYSMTDTVPHSSKFGNKEKKMKISLSTMFTDIKYLNELFAHLSREFSMECLLGMIEFIQLQQYILLHMQQYKNYYFKQFKNLKIKNSVTLPPGIPRSTIIYGNNDDLVEKYLHNQSGRIISVMEREQVRVRLISYQLYQKYAAIGSEWEINISYETRGRLTAKLHNFNEWMSAKKKNIQMWELAQLYEDSKHEMYRLLRHSFARFKRNEEFEKIRAYYQKKLEIELKKHEAKEKDTKIPKPGNYVQLVDQPSNLDPGDNDLATVEDILHDERQGTEDLNVNTVVEEDDADTAQANDDFGVN